MNEQTIFTDALEKPEAARQAFLAEACGSDRQMRKRIEQLLVAYENSPEFMDLPAGTLPDSLDASIHLQPGTQIGRYKLRELIGEGGMGVVYVADQLEPVRRKVALKIIKPGMASKEVVNRFESERQALSMMDHPNIARVFDGGVTDAGQPYFVMELVQGLPVTRYCDEHRLTTRERLWLFVAICKAVKHAHQKGIIHRDLKPSNIIVADIDGVAVPKVIDFGVAKAVNQSLTDKTLYTQFTQMVGTPLYMSPEQAGLGVVDIDVRSDVYSLGVLLYELLTGRTPFDSETLKQAGFDEMRRIIQEDDPPRPSHHVSTLNAEALSTVAGLRASHGRQLSNALQGELDWIVMEALEKDRNRRFESASALAADVERHLADEPVTARPASRWYHLKKFARRNRTLVASSAAVLLALAVGLVLSMAALAEAKRKQEDNRQLITLLGDMYPKAFGLVNPGKTRTVLESIDELSDQIDNGRLQGRPRVEIEARIIFADAYFSAMEFKKFRAHLDKALVLAEQEYGDDSLNVARIRTKLAYEPAQSGRTGGPERVLHHAERAIEIYQQHGQEFDKESNRAWVGKAIALRHWPERRVEAIAAAETVIQIEGEQTVHPYVDLGRIFEDFGDDDHLRQALQCYQRALENHEQSSDPQPNTRANLLGHKARCLRWLEDVDASRDAYLEAFDLFKTPALSAEPEGHGIGLWLADLHFAIGNVNEAFELVQQIEDTAMLHGVTSSIIKCNAFRGWLYHQLGESDAAVDFLEKATQQATESLDLMSGVHGRSSLHLALSYETQEPADIASAERQYRSVRQLTQTFVKPYLNPFVYWAEARADLATSEGDRQQLREAEKVADEGLQLVQARQQASFEPAFRMLKAMISRRRNADDLEPAIKELRQALDGATEPRATYWNSGGYQVPTDRWQVEAKLVDLLQEAGQVEQARDVLERGLKVRRAPTSLGPDHIQTVLAQVRLGQFLIKQREYEEALPLLTAAYDMAPLSDSRHLRSVRRKIAANLVATYKQLNQPAEAARWSGALEGLDGAATGIQ